MGTYESSQEDYTTSDTGSTTSVEFKYAQLGVPGYTLASAPATGTTPGATYTSTATTTGSSFLRLGSFPDVDVTSSYSGISGFANSLALISMVAGTESLATRYATADSSTTGKYGVLHSDPYQGDQSGDYLIGFMDDTRSRPGSINYNQGSSKTGTEKLYLDSTTDQDNSLANRQSETKRLMYKGGWWDHTDGNRIVTTGGDKIEIIQGNYRLAVLGRQLPPSTDMLYTSEYSGGINGSEYEWVSDGDGEGWAVYSSSSSKYAYKESHGVDVSVFTGTRKVSITGTNPGANIEFADFVANAGGGAVDYDGKLEVDVDPEGDPKIVSRTWAKKVETYVGSSGKPVQHTYSLSYGLTREDISFIQQTVQLRICFDNVSFAVGGGVLDVKMYPLNMAITMARLKAVSIIGAPLGTAYKIGREWAYSTAEKIIRGGGQKIPVSEKKVAAKATTTTLKDGTVVDTKSMLAAFNYNNYLNKLETGTQKVTMSPAHFKS